MHDRRVGSDRREMPSGREMTVDRLRSEGVLSEEEQAFCRSAGITMAFDPIQNGWITAAAVDDLPGRRIDDAARPEAASQPVKLSYRPWRLSDLEAYRDLLDDEEVWRHMPEPYPGPLTPELAASLIELSTSAEHHRVLAVLANGEPVGQVRLHFDAPEARDGEAELSYWLGRRVWGQGFASQAVTDFAARALSEDGAPKGLYAKVHPDNPASVRVLEKAGFARDGKNGDGWIILRRAA